ncbi:hypothetical protein FHS29_000203 [Saccharothrix tamanrassetensis]|uniref:Uncharacterized protein n=1 Tax=Saccharothrix tamanrassetensis TaxID=1051531 RepID=A0A841C9M0_9PSEU|nr:hypothetical protein [Saccharothrix tamanrassetensis]MBB5953633.1 hypothetical protein [Saccharothrix tamanrassetensis]
MLPVALDVAPYDTSTGSRAGGAAPACLALEGDLLDRYDYVLTIGAGVAPWSGGRELSVLLRRGFTVGDDDVEYPDIGAKAVLHPPSPRGDGGRGVHPGLGSAALVPVEADDEAAAFVRIADVPRLIQNEPTYAAVVEADGYRFLFQVEDDGLPHGDHPAGEFLFGDHPFGYGAIYFYGALDDQGHATLVVPGFLDF